MTNDLILKKLYELAENSAYEQAARRVMVLYRQAPPDVEPPRPSSLLPGVTQLKAWLSEQISSGAGLAARFVAQYKFDPQAFEELFKENMVDLHRLYENLLTAGSGRSADTLLGAAVTPSLELLTPEQRNHLLLLILEDFIQRAAFQPAGESPLPKHMGWLLNEMPEKFWKGLDVPGLELIQLYPMLLQAVGEANTARLTEQFGWLLSRSGARRTAARILEDLGRSLPESDTLLYLRLCEAALIQAREPNPPGVQRGGKWEAPLLHQAKGIDDVVIDDDVFIEDSSSVTLDGNGGEPVSSEVLPRRVQAEVGEITARSEVIQNAVLTAGRPHNLKVWIGDRSETSASANQIFDEEKLPELDFYPLTVVFSEPNHSPQEQVANITLFPLHIARDSTACNFNFIPNSEFPEFKARLIISYQNQVLQTLLLKGKVLVDPALADQADGFKLVVEADLQEPTGDLKAVSGRQASLFVEMSGQDLHLNVQMNGARVDRYIPGINAHTQRLIDQLKAVADAPRLYQKFDDPATVKLLRTLARHGSLLYQALAEQIGTAHPVFAEDVKTLQVLTAHEVLLPLELIYTAKTVRSDAGLCAGAQKALETGDCKCEAQVQEDARLGKVICPLLFWGLSRVIERHKIPPESGDADDLPRLNPTSAIPALMLSEVVYGSSSRVQAKDIEDLHQAVKTSLNKSSFVADWAAWSQAVKEEQPSLLLLIPHAEEQDGFLALEIGAGDFLPVDQITEEYVIGQVAGFEPDAAMLSQAVHPVVLVLGCSTAPLQVPFESCASVFRRAGAAMTVTTLSPVLGRHVVPVATILLQELRAGAQDQLSFGQALLRTRQRALAQGFPVVFALVADGNIDWQIA